MLQNLYDAIIKILYSDHPFSLVMSEILQGISSLWNYKIFITSGKHPVLVSNIIISIILFLAGLRLAKKFSQIIRKKLAKTLDLSAASALERLSYYVFIVLVAIFVLDISNVPLTVFTVVGTTFALGIGLGSQNIANNFISGLIIMVERPVKLGDIIEIKGITGQVMDIGARCISIRTDNNINMLVPNSNILQDVIVNWTHKDSTLRSSMSFRIDTALSIEEIDRIIIDAINKHPYILKQPPAKILYKSISKDYYDIEIEFWLDLASSSKSKHITNDINRSLAHILKQYNVSEHVVKF